jgi:hypothetical protein
MASTQDSAFFGNSFAQPPPPSESPPASVKRRRQRPGSATDRSSSSSPYANLQTSVADIPGFRRHMLRARAALKQRNESVYSLSSLADCDVSPKGNLIDLWCNVDEHYAVLTLADSACRQQVCRALHIRTSSLTMLLCTTCTCLQPRGRSADYPVVLCREHHLRKGNEFVLTEMTGKSSLRSDFRTCLRVGGPCSSQQSFTELKPALTTATVSFKTGASTVKAVTMPLSPRYAPPMSPRDRLVQTAAAAEVAETSTAHRRDGSAFNYSSMLARPRVIA